VVHAPGRSRRALSTDARRILAVQALRAFVYGLGSVLIGVTLAKERLTGLELGVVLAALLIGSASTSLLLARAADEIGRRRSYLLLLALMGIAGTAFALTNSIVALVAAALTGTVSTEVVESGPFTSLEQAMLPQTTVDPTRLFGTYNTVAAVAGSLGALAAGGPTLFDVGSQHLLLAYPAAAVVGLAVAARLTAVVEAPAAVGRRRLGASKRGVRQLSALFAVDSFAGGFVVPAFIAYWFAREYGTSPATLGVIFFFVGILQSVSFLSAVRIARSFGLINTMVFTHLPSNLLLAAIPLAPNEGVAIGLLLARFALSQMDVPTRQAYVVALVEPDERMAAAAYTNTARALARPPGALLAGPLSALTLGAPFVVSGALKSAYDLVLFALFRQREERSRTPRGAPPVDPG
jgi:predicted MFS family arabinose efflux permease